MSKSFTTVKFDLSKAREELDQFTALLAKRKWLDERKHILPFFTKRKQLCLLMGMIYGDTGMPDKIALEYDICGDFACDLVVVDSDAKAFTLVEFENGQQFSVFKRGTKHCPSWAGRFEQGFSQMVDWFWKLSEHRSDPDFVDRFGTISARFYGVLIIGRSCTLLPRERRRFSWRQNKMVLDSNTFNYLTFDDLREKLGKRVKLLESLLKLKASA